MIDVVPLRYDTAFRKAFGNVEVFCQFVKDILDIEIHVDEVIARGQYPNIVGFVEIEYDLFAEDTDKGVIVELQLVREEDLFDRFLYYHIIALVEQIKTYRDYRFNKTVYTVVVVTGPFRNEEKAAKFSHAIGNIDPINEFGKRLGIYPHKLIFLNHNCLNEKTPERVKKWLELIADSLDEQVDETRYSHPTLQTVIDKIKGSYFTPQELRRLKDEAAWEQTKLNAFKRGRRKREEEIAISLLKEGVDLDLIARITGLKTEEIGALRSVRSTTE